MMSYQNFKSKNFSHSLFSHFFFEEGEGGGERRRRYGIN